MTDNLLADAGCAGLDAYSENLDRGGDPTDVTMEMVACAVLEVLGIEWDGKTWEWRVDPATMTATRYGSGGGAGYDDARRIQAAWGGTLQRRPKLTFHWQETNDE